MASKGNVRLFDIIIIGSELYGIQAARYYFEVHPDARLIIIESDDVVGGTWSSKRMYNDFWTQTALGMAEFSDQPMRRPPKEDQYYDFFPAKYVTEYLESYVDSHQYSGKSIRDRILFSTRVQEVIKRTGLWHLTLNSGIILATPKLIDATGLTSLPCFPTIVGQEHFEGLQLHHKDFGRREIDILKDSKLQRVAIVGGAKSAADVAYACAKAGKEVSWIIRPDGAGPAAFLSAKGKGFYRNSNDGFYTRLVATFLPSPFNEKTLLYRFVQHTRLGNWLVRGFWNRADQGNRRVADYGRKEGKAMGFADLEPETELFWQNDSSGINQRSDFFPTVATKVHVYRRAIKSLSSKSINLNPSNNDIPDDDATQSIPIDAIIYCTGWLPTSPQFSHELAADLGLSQPISNDCKESTIVKDDGGNPDLDLSRAVTARFPLLSRPPPKFTPREPAYTPFRLYKAMAPLSDASSPSIVFLGKLVVGNNFRVAEVQALWAVAYLDGHIVPSPSKTGPKSKWRFEKFQTEAKEEVNLTEVWCRHRYLDKGSLGSWFFFDAISYSDMLLAHLGLTSHRGKGWLGSFKDLFRPCRAGDMKGLLEEYKGLYQTDRTSQSKKE